MPHNCSARHCNTTATLTNASAQQRRARPFQPPRTQGSPRHGSPSLPISGCITSNHDSLHNASTRQSIHQTSIYDPNPLSLIHHNRHPHNAPSLHMLTSAWANAQQ
jgi:hypothetical protein